MFETKELNINSVLQTARKTASEKVTPTFVSTTEKIENIDPLQFFQAGKDLKEDRIYWSSADRSIVFVGIGEAMVFQEFDQSYHNIQQKWQQVINNCVTDNPFPNINGGPIAFGGFPFDPQEKAEEVWGGFEGSQFRVPTFLLTIENNSCYLTTTVKITDNDPIEQIEKNVTDKKFQLLSSTSPEFRKSHINLQHEVDPEEWKSAVKKATETIAREPIDKIVLARELQVEFDSPCDVGQVLFNLEASQKNHFIFAWEKDDVCFVGATPERLVKVDNQHLFSTCLAGTAPRGRTKQEDARLGKELLHDPKNRQEHQFVVDMIKESIYTCAKSIDIAETPQLYPLKNLQHLYTPVRAELDSNVTLIDVVEKLHPTPALCGYPRESSLDFIRKFESLERGWYGAPIGWFDEKFNGEFAVAIRSALVNKDKASLFAGCGVVKGSQPENEYQETNIKFTPMLHALGGSL